MVSTSTVSVKVKWQKNKYDVNVKLDAPAEQFKSQLYELTGISPDRQKITVGAKQITDTTDLASMGLKEKQVLMLFGSPDEALKVPPDTQFGSPNNVCDLFRHMDRQEYETPKQIGDNLTADGHDHMQVANCLIVCRPKTTAQAKQWIEDNIDGAASTHIAGQKVPDSWKDGVEYSMGSADRSFNVGDVVVLRRSDGSIKFGLLQQMNIYPDAHFVLVECDADFQGRGSQAGKAVKIQDIGKLTLDDPVPPMEESEK